MREQYGTESAYAKMADIVAGLGRRLRLSRLERHYSRRPVLAAFTFVNSGISIALLSVVALVLNAPMVFPSLGPTAFLFFYRPTVPSAAPRNALLGHGLGAAVGYLSLVVTGLTTAGSTLVVGMSWARILAVGLAVSCTAGGMVLGQFEHAPAISTTLLVALGTIDRPRQLAVLVGAVAVLAVQAFVINRAAGVQFPLWAAPTPARAGEESRERSSLPA